MYRLSRQPGNGYPEEHRLDGRIYVDEAEWDEFWAQRAGGRVVVDGVAYVSTAERAERTGRSIETVRWWATLPNHPTETRRHGRSYVAEKPWETWYATYTAGLRARLTEVDRSGDPDDLIGSTEASRVLGYNPHTVHALHAAGQFMAPDVEDPLPAGGTRPLWRRRRVWAFADHRSGPGRAGGARAAMADLGTPPPH